MKEDKRRKWRILKSGLVAGISTSMVLFICLIIADFRKSSLDDDNDGIPNHIDPFPTIHAKVSNDFDGNGKLDMCEPDNPDADTDGDGIPNKEDPLPRCNLIRKNRF